MSSWLDGTRLPITGSTETGYTRSWAQVALEDPDAFAAGLASLGLPQGDEHEAVSQSLEVAAQLRAVHAEADSYRVRGYRYLADPVPPEVRNRQASLWSRLTDVFRREDVHVEATTVVTARVPIFTLAAATVDGCTATFSTQSSRMTNLNWNLTVFGSGVGGSRELTTTVQAEFAAASGETKIVFIDLSMPVQQVVLTKGGAEIGRGLQVDAANVAPVGSPGLVLAAPGDRPAAGNEVTRFPLAGDTTGALATYQWMYSRTSSRSLTLGLSAFNSTLSVTVGSQLAHEIALTYQLRGGHDYTLRDTVTGDGLVWSDMPGTPDPRSRPAAP